MVVNETLPMCPDTVIDAENDVVLSEPVEVGPFRQGIVFVRLLDPEGSPTVDASVGISPSGYEDWDEQWTEIDAMTELESDGVHALRLSNFGNWLRVRFEMAGAPSPEDRVTVLAWFVGDG